MRSALRQTIRLEAETLEELRSAVDEQIDRAAALLALVGDDRAAVIQILRGITRNIQTGVTQIIVTARESAAHLAYATVIIEASLAEDSDLPDDNEEDAARAMIVGMSYSSAWLAAALAAVVLGIRDLKRVTRTQDYRLERIATTEVFEAYSAASLEHYKQLPADQWLKRWDAILDARVCHECEAHDGEEVPLDEEFKHGDVPGDIHPKCRCVTTLIRLSTSQAA